MELTNTQRDLIKELRNQDVDDDWIQYILKRLKTEKQQQTMMSYLMTTRNKLEELNKLILKTIEIKNSI